MPEVSPEVAQIITRKKLWYCRYSDTNQWELWDQVALPECTYEYHSNGKVFSKAGFTYAWGSSSEFTAFFSKAFENLQTIHMVGPGEFEQVSDDEVKAVFTVIYFSSLKKTATESHGVQGTGGGHYFETYKRKGDDWFLATLKMNRVYEQGD
ncbi:hypothetical protein BX600DRAFT_499190 [Xylariales sp. PMI_506]|nr:hypothetical protein BX600DRAFT_499190 [Xylariales sp. PMI_506]